MIFYKIYQIISKKAVNNEELDLVRKEAKILGLLNHINIVRLHKVKTILPKC